MNKIDFIPKTIEDHPIPLVDILIDKQNIIELLKQYELPFARKEGSPNIAGGYLGLSAKSLYHQLTRDVSKGWPKGDRCILTCNDCLEDGCWPMFLTVEETENEIIWKDFQQPHRGKHSKVYWDYSKFGPFVFDKTEYEKKLPELKGMLI